MKRFLKISLMAATAITSAPLWAQEAPANTAAEDADVIIVTARKKEETLLDAPLAVTVVGQRELESAGFQDITQITRAAPGAFVEPNGDGQNAARIDSTPRFRGVTVISSSRLQQTATVFLDGIYMSSGAQTVGINELQRVEIIKGPQSALFGRNTFAGAINYVTKDPSDEWRVDVSATGATRNEYNFAAGVEGPLFSGVSFRLGGNYDDKQGHFANAAVPGQHIGDQSQWSINGTLMIEPSDGIRLKLRGSYQEIDDGVSASIAHFGTNQHNFGGFAIVNGIANQADSIVPRLPDSLASSGRGESVFKGRITQPPANRIGMNTAPANIKTFMDKLRSDARLAPTDAVYRFKYNPFTLDDFGLNLSSVRLSAVGSADLSDNIQFNFLAGYNREQFGFFNDYDATPDDSFMSWTGRDTEDLTLEGRLSAALFDDKLNVAVGASFVKLDMDDLSGTASTMASTIGAFFAPPYFFSDIFRSDPFVTGSETTGFFGSLDYAFTDQISLTLEGRFQKDVYSNSSVLFSPGEINSFIPRATLRYQPSNYTTLYATYSEGNLPGGFNSEVGGLSANALAELLVLAQDARSIFGEEQLINYEFGWKQQDPSGMFGFNLAAFYMQRKDEIFSSIQVIKEDRPGFANPTRTVSFISNGASTDIYGVELDATFNISEKLSLQGSFAYIDAKIASFPANGGTGDFGDIFGSGVSIAGQEAPRFPPLTMSLGTNYEDDVDAFGGLFETWYLRGDVYFTGDYFDSNANVASVPEATEVNLRVGLRGETVNVELFATNLFETSVPTTAFNFADLSFGTRARSGGFFNFGREGDRVGLRDKRQFGLKVKYTFK
mgnify:FL=1